MAYGGEQFFLFGKTRSAPRLQSQLQPAVNAGQVDPLGISSPLNTRNSSVSLEAERVTTPTYFTGA